MPEITINTETAIRAASEAISEYPDYTINNLLNVSENIIFEVADNSGKKAVLRIHRPNYQTSLGILSELKWMAFLFAQGIQTPEPIKNRCGQYITPTTNNLHATMITWIAGESLHALHEKHPVDSPAIDKIYCRLGKVIADIHNATDSFEIPVAFERSSWDIKGFLGTNPLWGRFWENPVLTRGEKKFLLDLKSKLITRLEQFLDDGADYGLIHADVISENVLVANGYPIIIDYDDSGYGFRMYDLAVPLYRFYPSPSYRRLAGLLKIGYQKNRSLSEKSWDLLNVFVLLRRLAMLGWVVPRKSPEEIAIKTRDNLRVIEALVEEINLD
ncbi:MAG: phosphotransferase [Paracoccaceae bacterium]|nr:phosphotransferase [Paracoccaceae bacterium]MDE2916701.1 phosphotransferase [Paracoccaceae bacterium]